MYTRVLYFARYSVPTLLLRRPRGGAKTFQHRSSERAVKPGKLLDATTQAGRVLAAAEIRWPIHVGQVKRVKAFSRPASPETDRRLRYFYSAFPAAVNDQTRSRLLVNF